MQPRTRLLPLALAALLAGCGAGATDPSGSATGSGAPPSPTPPPSDRFAYEPGSVGPATLAPQAVLEDGTTIQDLSYPGPSGGAVSAWLVTPPGDGPFAGMLYLHGSETDRDDLLDEAMAMATGGVASIVLDAPWVRDGEARGSEAGNYFAPEEEVAMMEQIVTDLRAGIDVLVRDGKADPERIGFMGHSWGASTGAILAAVDDRPIAFALVTGRPSWTDFLRSEAEGRLASIVSMIGQEKWEAYLAALAPFDAVAQIGAADGQELLLQFGTADDVVTPDAVEAFTAAAPDGTTVQTFDAGHVLDGEATAARIAWLAERLGADPIAPEAVERVGLPDAPTAVPVTTGG
ncbi:MAG TPA: prolyl oligopeptidase family serine peptidase [Gemmatimonadales bacterium]|nr:prolyl oligopeptidase family serine peptidase [Gemmatimonadales bacterium]